MPSGQFQCPVFSVVFSAKWTSCDVSAELGESYVRSLNKFLIYVMYILLKVRPASPLYRQEITRIH